MRKPRLMQRHIVIDARIRRSSTGRYTDRLVEHLQTIDKNNRYTILVESDDNWEMKNEKFTTLPCSFPQFSLNPVHDFQFATLLRSLQPDLVHFTMTQQPLTYRGCIVTTTHDLTMLRFIRAGHTPLPIFFLKKLGYKLLFYVAHKKSAQIIVPTQYVADDLSKYQPFTQNKITVTYEASEPQLSGKSEMPDDERLKNPFIFHLGSPFPHKNLRRLIEAFELLKQKDPELVLVLAGKREFYFAELEAWSETLHIFDSIVFTGFVSDGELKWLYENAECYVLPSLSEGFGLPGLEAMAHGCPLVSSNATCLPEVYGDAAEYFDPTDTLGMVKTIKSVMDSKKRQKELVAAGHKQIQKYSWRKMAKKTLAVYDNLTQV